MSVARARAKARALHRCISAVIRIIIYGVSRCISFLLCSENCHISQFG